jgi:ornithine cyclodeaminase
VQLEKAPRFYAFVHALCEGTLHARQRDQSITLFDSVGFALEDYSALVYVLNESTRLGAGSDAALLPQSDDPKDLFAFLA